MNKYFRYAGISLILVLVQTTAAHLRNDEGVIPDVLAIWVVYLALTEGQMDGMLWGFAIGLLLDLTTQDFIGLSTLAKTLCGFLAGYFYNENKTRVVLGSYRFILIVFVVTLIQNTIYFAMFTQGSDINLLRAIVHYGLTTTLYTAVFTAFPVLYFSRRITV